MGILFGTDGIRGIANRDLSCELMMKIGRAAASVLASGSKRPRFVIGMDPRISSEMLAASIAAGICSAGGDVELLGVVPTPAVAFLVSKYGADAGVMISASHNSAEYNGVKFFSDIGLKLSDETEEQIERIVLGENEESCTEHIAELGRISIRADAVDVYVEYLKKTVGNSLAGISVAVDCANGAASATVRKLFSELNVDCRILNDRPDGMNINRLCGSTHLENLRQYVLEHRLDMGIAFDGDADRCVCIDAYGNTVDGDFLMAIFAKDLKRRGLLRNDTVVCTVMSNFGFMRFCDECGIQKELVRVGDRYVIEAMLEHDCNFGGEQSGHLIFRDYATTGDGQLTAIQLLSLLKRWHISLSDAASIMKRFPQVIINVPVSADGKKRLSIDAEIASAIEKERIALGDEGRLLVRASGTEPLIRVMTEGMNEQQIGECAEQIARLIKARLSE